MRTIHKPGFTLVETLVSTLIAVILLGAATTASQSVGRSAQTGQEQAQMNAIADTLFTDFQLLQADDASRTILHSIATFDNKSLPDGTHLVGYGQFYDRDAKQNRPLLKNSLEWIPYDTANGFDKRFDSTNYKPLGFIPFTVKTVTDSSMFANGGSLEGSASPFGKNVPVTSLVAVCAHPGYLNNNPGIATCLNSTGMQSSYANSSSSTFLMRAPWDAWTIDPPPDIDSDPDWNAYEVSSSLAELTSSDPAFKDALGVPTAFVATVRVANYHKPSSQITRTMLLTDWQK